jgi:hypothetical protein
MMDNKLKSVKKLKWDVEHLKINLWEKSLKGFAVRVITPCLHYCYTSIYTHLD